MGRKQLTPALMRNSPIRVRIMVRGWSKPALSRNRATPGGLQTGTHRLVIQALTKTHK